MGFMVLEEVYDKYNREALCQVLRILLLLKSKPSREHSRVSWGCQEKRQKITKK